MQPALILGLLQDAIQLGFGHVVGFGASLEAPCKTIFVRALTEYCKLATNLLQTPSFVFTLL